jgi:hypothetical protein
MNHFNGVKTGTGTGKIPDSIGTLALFSTIIINRTDKIQNFVGTAPIPLHILFFCVNGDGKIFDFSCSFILNNFSSGAGPLKFKILSAPALCIVSILSTYLQAFPYIRRICKTKSPSPPPPPFKNKKDKWADFLPIY